MTDELDEPDELDDDLSNPDVPASRPAKRRPVVNVPPVGADTADHRYPERPASSQARVDEVVPQGYPLWAARQGALATANLVVAWLHTRVNGESVLHPILADGVVRPTTAALYYGETADAASEAARRADPGPDAPVTDLFNRPK